MMLLKKIYRHPYLLPYCFEAVWELLCCKILILFFPFQFYAKKYGIAQCETLQENRLRDKKITDAIRNVLRVVPPLLPWNSKCLDQAVAAQNMLKRRGLQNTLYFGMTKNEKNELAAHAWLRSGSRWIVGYQPDTNYTVVGTYAYIPEFFQR